VAFLLRVPPELDSQVRERAAAENKSLTDWWLDAGRSELHGSEMSARDAARVLNHDPVTRWVLDRLGE